MSEEPLYWRGISTATGASHLRTSANCAVVNDSENCVCANEGSSYGVRDVRSVLLCRGTSLVGSHSDETHGPVG